MDYLPAHGRDGADPRSFALEANTIRPPALSTAPPGYIEVNTGESGAGEWSQWLEYWDALMRHKVAIVASALLGIVLAVAAALFETPLYGAGATLEVQAQLSQEQPFQGISFMNSFDPYLLQTQTQLLRSGMLQDRVYARMLQHRADPAGPGAAQHAAVIGGGPLAGVRRRLGMPSATPDWQSALQLAVGSLKVAMMKDTRIMTISAESTRPDVAADYINTLISEYMQQSLEDRWSMYQTTGTWLTRAQAELKSKLEQSERQLLDYAAASGLVVSGKNEDIAEQTLAQMQLEVSRAQADRIAKESVYRTALAQPADSLADVLDHGLMSQYQSKLADLRRELADATTSLTPAHPKVRRLEAQIDEVTAATKRETDNILNRMRTDYETALRRERQLTADLASQSKVLSNQDQKLIRYRMLQREVETYRNLYDTTLQKGKEATLASALRPINARIVDSARAARAPYRPNLTFNMILGIFGGLVGAVALVLVRESADASIRVPGAVTLSLNVRELGVIPAAKSDPDSLALTAPRPKALPAAKSSRPRLMSAEHTQSLESVELTTWNRKASMLAEAFRATLTSILSAEQNGRGRQVILVTSPSPQEGKSTVITNLAIALAEIHQRVLLVDADMRRPRLHSVFNQANTSGLSDLLREKTPCQEYPAEALGKRTHVPRLFLLPSGPGCVNVSRLFYSTRMADLAARLRNEFDAVLIDTPPVLSVADARILSRLADAVVLVFRAGRTTRDAAAMAVNVFEADGVPVFGTVLNDWNPRTMGRGYYPPDYTPYSSAGARL